MRRFQPAQVRRSSLAVSSRKIGNNDLQTGALALGTWAMGGDVTQWGHVDDRESIAAIQQSLDRGVTLIDTAPTYGAGHSEEIVGNAIHGRRNSVIVATKCGLVPPVRNGAPPARCLTPARIVTECNASLRRLRTDVIDLYQCHWPDPATPIRETMRALSDLLREGKIRAVGLANCAVEEVAAAREFGPVHAVQAPFSLIHPKATDELLPYCAEHEIAFLACGPLAKGLLAGKFNEGARFGGVRARDLEFVGARFRRNLQIVDRLRAVAKPLGITVAQLTLSWTIHQPGVTAAIAGAKLPSQAIENARSAGITLSHDDQARIAVILAEATREP